MLMSKLRAPYRFDHVGSFLRPNRLKIARGQLARKEITSANLKAIEDEEILKIIEKQEKAGLKSITDGEFRRSWWHHDFFWGLNGVEKAELEMGNKFRATNTRAETGRIIGKISGNHHPFVDHFKFVKNHVSKGFEPKQAIPAPAQFIQESLRPGNYEATRNTYPTNEELVDAVAKAYIQVLNDLKDVGATTVQFDDCTWGRLIGGEGYGGKYNNQEKEALKDLYLSVNNKVLEGAPGELTINSHVCRGNYQSTWFASGGYDSVANHLFAKERVNAFFLEYDSDRSGTFKPLEKIESGKKVVLGLVTTKSSKLENREILIERIKEASNYVPLEDLYLSPQCGFSSTEEGNKLTEEDQWKKIELIRSVAEEVWGGSSS